MTGTANPVDLIGGLASASNVVKADVSAWAKARVVQLLANAAEINNTILANQLAVALKSTGSTYLVDTLDSTSPDDGVNVIISSDGLRFKPVSTAGKNIVPLVNDGGSVGTAALEWSDIFLASGATINFNNGNYVVTHSSGKLSFSGEIMPTVNDGAALGDATLKWSDLFLASGAVINFNNGDLTLTHAANLLTYAGGDLVISNTTVSTSPTTGAVQIAGGVGISGALYVGGTSFSGFAAALMNATASATTSPVLRLDSSYGAFTSIATVDMTINGNAANIVGRIGFPINSADSSGDITLMPSSNFVSNNTAEVLRARNNATGKGIIVTGSILSKTSDGVGYAAGAGGTQVQPTNKSTGLTLNKASGQITMNNAALAATTTVSFVLTNSVIAATDITLVQIVSGNATVGTYQVWAEKSTAGTVTINVRNMSAGSLSEALVIQFSVIKSVIT